MLYNPTKKKNYSSLHDIFLLDRLHSYRGSLLICLYFWVWEEGHNCKGQPFFSTISRHLRGGISYEEILGEVGGDRSFCIEGLPFSETVTKPNFSKAPIAVRLLFQWS